MRAWMLALALLAAAPAHAADIWLTPTEIAALDTTGSAWTSLMTRAKLAIGTPDVSNQNDNDNVYTLANALVYVRKLPDDPGGAEVFRTKVRAACMAAIGTDSDGLPNPHGNPPDPDRTLALGRELASYIIAAQYVGLTASENNDFKYWLRGLNWKRYAQSPGSSDLSDTAAYVCTTCTPPDDPGNPVVRSSLKNTHRLRPNNWGTMAGASRAAIAAYLDSTAMLAEVAATFHAYLGDRSVYTGFVFDDDLSWHCNPAEPRGVNPECVKQGRYIGGATPDDVQRGGPFAWPPGQSTYPWEGFQGAVMQAEILARNGFPEVWTWEDRAILRAAHFLWRLEAAFPGWWAAGDDRWVPWVVNHAYGTTFTTAAPSSSSPGKNVGWTDWTHSAAGCDACRDCP